MPEIISRLSTALADRYAIERHLGEGDMATVYLAEDLKHKGKVAVKVLRPELAAVLGAERFVQEITTTADLRGLVRRLALVLLLAGCGGTDAAIRWAGTIDTLPNGAVRVANPAQGIWNDESAWRLAPELVIGEMEGPDATLFAAITGLQVDDVGRIYVLDRQANELRVFAPNGSHLQTVGRSGRGPGEYTNANGLLWLSGDTLVVVDQRGGRYTLLTRDGQYARSEPRRLGFYGWVFFGGYHNGRIYERASVGRPPNRQYALVGSPLAGADAVAPEAGIDTVLLPKPSAPLFESFSVRTSRGGMTMSIPFASVPAYHLDWAGNIWHGHGSEFRVVRSSFAGDTLTVITVDAGATPVTTAELAEWEAGETVARFRDMGGQLDMDRIPKMKPFFDGLYLGPDGYLWVSVPTAPMQVEFAVFDADGRYLGRLLAQGLERNTFVPPVVRNSRLYLVGRDELDVQRVYAFAIER